MRHQPFFGWIKDLSAADPTTIFNLFGLIPWDPPSFMIIGIWPILMGASMWVQQKLNPAPADPIQAKIFAFFPVIFNNYFSFIPIRSSCLLDSKQYFNNCSAVCNCKTNYCKNKLNVPTHFS